MNKFLSFLSYVGLFFLLGLPVFVGFGLAIASGTPSYTTSTVAAHSFPGTIILNSYATYGILLCGPWIALMLYVTLTLFVPSASKKPQ